MTNVNDRDGLKNRPCNVPLYFIWITEHEHEKLALYFDYASLLRISCFSLPIKIVSPSCFVIRIITVLSTILRLCISIFLLKPLSCYCSRAYSVKHIFKAFHQLWRFESLHTNIIPHNHQLHLQPSEKEVQT